MEVFDNKDMSNAALTTLTDNDATTCEDFTSTDPDNIFVLDMTSSKTVSQATVTYSGNNGLN